MKPVYYRKWLIRVAEVWFLENERPFDADVVRYMHVPSPVKGAWYESFHTLVVGMSGDDEGMLKRMDEGTRYEIRRAQAKDDLGYAHRSVGSLDDMHEFIAAYKSAAREDDALPQMNLQRLFRMAEAGLLDLSVTRDRRGRTLSWHMHVVAAGIARLFYSLSAFSSCKEQQYRNLCGRANRLHHWLDMLRFREAGCDKYDFGGYSPKSADAKKRQISRFKRSFGGEETLTYNCVYPRTVAGRIALVGWHVLEQPPGSEDCGVPP